MGTVCGLIIGLWARFMAGAETGLSPANLAVTVGIALFAAMTFAAVFGAFVPMALNRFRVDPAVASGPFVTIANDIFALLIYFGITVLLVYRLT
jgi:Mg/Co/Ni transporter MgtE